IFERPRPDPAEDQALARAIEAARCVVLLEVIRKHDRSLGPGNGLQGLVTTRRVVRPIPVLADPALAVAPFPLPKLPMRLNHFWTFVPRPELRPTMPIATLRQHLRGYDETWQRLVEDLGAADAFGRTMPLRAEMAMSRTRMLEQPRLVSDLRQALDRLAADIEERRAISALIDVVAGPEARWINFYGPPGAITTWPAHAVLDDQAFGAFRDEVRGRAVFIGLAELYSDHEDDFQTIYSRSGVDLAGVEVAATIFANFIDGRLLEPLTGSGLALLLLLFGGVVAAASSLLPAVLAIPCVIGIAFAYTGLATQAFAHSLWLPIAIPLLVQLPVGLFGGLFLQYRAARHGERNLASGISYYLPSSVASALAETPSAAARTELVDGVCFVSDIEHFTRLAERRSATDVSELLNRYFDVAFDAIRAEGGLVTDIVGDGITAFWRSTGPESRLAVCRAALALEHAVGRLDAGSCGSGLATRVGISAGQVVLGGVGGSGRFAYSVIGDPVNTASRLEKLNKHLGTLLIAGASVVQDLPGLVVRPLGDFILYGKEEVVALVEILEPGSADRGFLTTFGSSRAAFQAGRTREAAAGFERILERRGDGPSRFYLRLCREDPDLPALRVAGGVVRLLEK
ncbi:MAG: adenylate/guanylate cyclase domain-containing protein, partial [Geminicoccaceae bacterium]|nr:adenylate/guanylate cyclase domain-containing protein [Geminicoccaceae bacterium]